MDTLIIKSLQVSTRIGVHHWEQQINQPLSIDITLPVDFSCCEDKLNNVLDYDRLCQTITDSLELLSFQLIESVANHIAELIKQTFHVPQVTVAVSKPSAIKNAGTVQVVAIR